MNAIPFQRDPTLAEVEVEQSVIALLLEGQETAWRVLDLTSRDDFLEPLHQRVFDAARRILDANGEISALTLGAALGSDVGLNQVGGAEYFRRMRQRWPRNADIASDLCGSLIDLTQRRRLAAKIATAETALSDHSTPCTEIMADLSESLQSLSEGRQAADDPVGWYDAGKRVVEALEERSAGIRRNEPLSYGIDQLDSEIGGMAAGDLVILAGRPGMGKSAIAIHIAHAAASRGGVYLASLEMSDQALLQRSLSMRAYQRGVKIPYNLIRLGRVQDSQSDHLVRALVDDATLPMVIDQRRGLTVAQIGVRARRAAARFRKDGKPLALVVIDHLGLIEPADKFSRSRVTDITEMTRSLKILAGRLGVPVLCLCQLNRAVEGRDDKRPYLSDLRDSGSIEQDADVVILAHRAEYYLKKHPPRDDAPQAERGKYEAALLKAERKLDLMVAKNRNGPEATITVKCDIAYNWIGE